MADSAAAATPAQQSHPKDLAHMQHVRPLLFIPAEVDEHMTPAAKDLDARERADLAPRVSVGPTQPARVQTCDRSGAATKVGSSRRGDG